MKMTDEKIADLVRDAFYEGRELGPWPRTLTEADKHSAWLGSESRAQLVRAGRDDPGTSDPIGPLPPRQ